jgi:Flp pilus assembly protein TadG
MQAVRASPRSRVLRGLRFRGRRDDSGFIAVATAIIVPVLLALSAFTVDVGNWYYHAESVQRAADAAALAGVTYLPGDLAAAKKQAIATAAANGYANSATVTVDPEPVSGNPNQLQVTITEIVDNSFGKLMGVSTETIRRTAIANYQAPLPLGSPCNEFGDGPEPKLNATNPRSSNCSNAGAFWANVGSPKASKSYGDAYQDGDCASSASGTDNCSGTNSDYSTNGYFYSIKVTAPVTNLTIQAFDPNFVYVGDLCDSNFGSGTSAAVNAKNQYNYSAGTSAATAKYLEDNQLYAPGQNGAYCTGDMLYTQQSNQPPDTTYTVRAPSATANPWDPTTNPIIGGCTQTYKGFSGDLYTALNQYAQTNGAVTYAAGKPVAAATGTNGYQDAVAKSFRQWSTLCTIPGTIAAGTYYIQVQSNAPGDNTNGDGHNRFAMRAFGSGPSDNANIAISGFTDMAMYADLPSAHTSFYLTQITPGAAGQILQIRLFDIGDSSQPGTVRVIPPLDSGLTTFSGCVGAGPTSGALTNCSIPANSSYNGKWETISVPIPSNYTCNYQSAVGCWITLSYDYGAGQPSDTTSWQASLEGTPVRLTK